MKKAISLARATFFLKSSGIHCRRPVIHHPQPPPQDRYQSNITSSFMLSSRLPSTTDQRIRTTPSSIAPLLFLRHQVLVKAPPCIHPITAFL
ncbi:hypothetical protein K438DRAFT_1843866 [Mycena galopus ATCC 62051]|nr:hypothetical protein K438DRAFT_1843866 [Mycena galopus ATCC 62051]